MAQAASSRDVRREIRLTRRARLLVRHAPEPWEGPLRLRGGREHGRNGMGGPIPGAALPCSHHTCLAEFARSGESHGLGAAESP